MEVRKDDLSDADLNAIFAALADPTRRAILRRLTEGEASVKDIAAPFRMSQPAISKHLRTLERAGLVQRQTDRQRRPARLNAAPLEGAVAYLESFRDAWSARLDGLESLLDDMTRSKGHPDD